LLSGHICTFATLIANAPKTAKNLILILISVSLFELLKKYKIEVYSTVHLCERVYKVADPAKMADTRGMNTEHEKFLFEK